MKRAIFFSVLMAVATTVWSQTLNVRVGQVIYQFPSAQTGDMTYADASTLTIMGKVFTLSDITNMVVDGTEVVDNTVSVSYQGDSATVYVAGNVARYVEPTVSGAHVSIAQSSDVDDTVGEITYSLSGTSTDGEFYLSGSYKSTLELNGLTLTNATPVYSGAAIHVQNGKRINIKLVKGTVNTITDAANGSQKGCLYVKGHAEFKQKGTLNVVGNTKHAIKAGEYITIKNATINITSAQGDGINCAEYFLMESGSLSISGTADDGVQCDVDGDASTGETTDHDDEDSGNIYVSGGTISVNVSGKAAKGIKSEGDINISGGDITVTTSGSGTWDSDDSETKASSCMSSDRNMTISGGTLTLTSTGSGGKGIKVDSVLTVTGGDITVKTTGGLYYNNGTTEYTNYTGNTDNVSNAYYSSPKGIKAGQKTETSSSGSGWGRQSSYTYSGGIVISGGKIYVSTSGTNAEGIESKNTIDISGGEVMVEAYDDAINSGQDMTISGGYVYAHGLKNDGLDANGNVYIKGGLVYAISSAGAPEVAIDANTEEQKKLYIQGGTLVAIGGLESGASISQTCYSASSYSANTWYALTVGSSTFAFKTPSGSSSSGRGGGFGPGGGGSSSSSLIVSGSSTPTLKSGVTASGTEIFNGNGKIDATTTGGSSVSLSTYSGGGRGR